MMVRGCALRKGFQNLQPEGTTNQKIPNGDKESKASSIRGVAIK